MGNELRVAGCKLQIGQIASCGLRVASCGLRVAGCGLVAGRGSRVAGRGSRVGCCVLHYMVQIIEPGFQTTEFNPLSAIT